MPLWCRRSELIVGYHLPGAATAVDLQVDAVVGGVAGGSHRYCGGDHAARFAVVGHEPDGVPHILQA